MKSLLATPILLILTFLSSASLLRAGEKPATDADALAQAQPKFLEAFVPKDAGYVTKMVDPPEDWFIYRFKEVKPSVSADELSEVDAMNGVAWRGRVSFEAKFRQGFLGVHSARGHSTYDGLHPFPWTQGGTIFQADVEKRQGKWTVTPAFLDRYVKPTAAELRDLDVALKLPEASGGGQ